jgi:hypothetical protein
MKLIYEGEQKFKLLLPHEVNIEKGTVIETNNKELQATLKEHGFTKQEGGK